MAEAGDQLLLPLRHAFNEYAWTTLPNRVKIVKALAGYDSGIIGAVRFPQM